MGFILIVAGGLMMLNGTDDLHVFYGGLVLVALGVIASLVRREDPFG